MSTIRKTVSMPQKVLEAAERQMAEYGYKEFSDYIQALIRADSGVQPQGQQLLQETGTPYHISSLPEAEKKIAEAVQAEGQTLLKKSKKTKRP